MPSIPQDLEELALCAPKQFERRAQELNPFPFFNASLVRRGSGWLRLPCGHWHKNRVLADACYNANALTLPHERLLYCQLEEQGQGLWLWRPGLVGSGGAWIREDESLYEQPNSRRAACQR